MRLGKPAEAAVTASTALALFDKSFVGSLSEPLSPTTARAVSDVPHIALS